MSGSDWGVIALYGGLVVAVGLFAARRHQKVDDLALGGRAMPVWAVLLSMIATELSAATFIGVPNDAYQNGHWLYIELAFGALFAKGVLAFTLIPLYHRLRVVTVYEFLEKRFGPRARRRGSPCSGSA